jgi:hypothetical protein
VRALRRADAPDEDQLVEGWDCEPFTPCRVVARRAISLPQYGSEPYQSFDLEGEGEDEDVSDAYSTLEDELETGGPYAAQASKLLGYPAEFSTHPSMDAYVFRHRLRRDRRYGKVAPESREWVLLLELASHREAGMLWWDAGRLHFMIRRDDLARRRFDNTYAGISTS